MRLRMSSNGDFEVTRKVEREGKGRVPVNGFCMGPLMSKVSSADQRGKQARFLLYCSRNWHALSASQLTGNMRTIRGQPRLTGLNG